MFRDILSELEQWKTHPLRKPLILKGARQVGKSWAVQEFGKTFSSFVSINFEKEKDAKIFFEGDIKIADLIDRLSLYSGKKIIPGETLLFFDEIQDCENAIAYLRYFKEELPDLHVIAAGSLIDFVLEKTGLPVGRVQFLHLFPISFGEYLIAIGRDDLRQNILTSEVDPVIHHQILEQLKTYMCIGGMPAVVQAWISYKDILLCQEAQDEIINTYRQDFIKYARRQQIEYVTKVFNAIPLQLGRKFKYSNVDPDMNLQPIKNALSLLKKAGIALPVHHSSGQGVPLGAAKDTKKFKIFFFDVGLAQRILGLDLKSWVVMKLKIANIGAIAEQLVAQEFMAYSPPKIKQDLYYWHKESPSSNAEVDFLFVKGGEIVPVEIKSGVRGGLKSMQIFLDTHPASKYGLKISENPFSLHSKIREIPLYGIEAWLKGGSIITVKK